MARLILQRLLHAADPTARRLLLGGFIAACLAWPALAAQEDDEVQPDLNALRAKAESGSVKAQTQLADFFIGSDDFTNAVVWYRKAAEQGDVTAQLSLASLLMAGRGAAKNPQEAAKWLRAAADRIETNKPGYGPGAVVASTTNPPVATATNPPAKLPPNAIVITKANLPPATNAVVSVPQTNTPPTNQTAFTRVPRAGVVDQTAPALQEAQPVLRPPTEPR
jgi:hypothetical protein